jgi:Mrp family chromosome partitioning ATPase
MSALDQAFIKAYAKDGPSAGDSAGRGAAPSSPANVAVAGPSARCVRIAPADADAIERIYHEGSLYRVDVPRASAPRRTAVPTPHFQLPPPTSPKRNVRRSMLQLLGQASDLATPMPVEPPTRSESVVRRLPGAQQPARVARTLSEIADELSPLAVPTSPVPRPTRPPVRRTTRVELAPEVIIDAPQTDEPLPIKTAPAPQLPLQPLIAPTVPPPSVAPLNLAQTFGPAFEVHGHWESALAERPASLVITPEPADLHIAEPAPLVELRLDALPECGPLERGRAVPQADAASIAANLPPTPSFRVDPPHATAAGKPHAKFTPATEEPPITAEAVSPDPAQVEARGYFGDAAEEAESPPTEMTPLSTQSAEELKFAEQEPEEPAPTSPAQTTADAPESTRSEPATLDEAAPRVAECVPLWEVDRFQWPVTVERLVSDKDGYFAQASGRLLAAVRDGLRTLAISGSRRGEGRTTLALALARCAAKAGIQVAVIDADFARPQLAGRIGLEIHHGWQDAATGLVPLSEAAIRSLADNITVLPLEASVARTGLSLADPRVTATLRAAAATFELVIVDLGPLAASDEPLFPADEACPLDAAIVVRDLRYASAAESEDVGQRLMAAGIEAVGIAENFVVEEEIPATSV